MKLNYFNGGKWAGIMSITLVLVVLCLASGIVSSSKELPCEIKDIPCIENVVNMIAPKILSGSVELGVESSDPLFVKLVEGNLSILNFKLFNSTATGYKNCKVGNMTLDEDVTKLQYDYYCPKVTVTGKYEISGRLVTMSVEGRGDFIVDTGEYRVHVYSDLNKVEKDGKTYLTIKNFNLICEALTAIRFEFKNLFNGQKVLSDAVEKFAHENWKVVAEQVQDPVWNSFFKGIITNVNKYLKQVPLEDLTQQ